eukprot:3367110-Pleurochrysis_carterae.AAC.1
MARLCARKLLLRKWQAVEKRGTVNERCGKSSAKDSRHLSTRADLLTNLTTSHVRLPLDTRPPPYYSTLRYVLQHLRMYLNT